MDKGTISLCEPIIMKLQPEWFHNGYYVYVVVIKYNIENYYYVGMTGDRKHKVARSPFYRMGGHFILSKSTQNQIIKGLQNKLNFVVKDDSNILCDMDITYYAWLINPYIKSIAKTEHDCKREIGESIESALIVQCKEAFGKENVFNKNLSRKDFDGYKLHAKKILKQLKIYVNE